MAERNIAPVAHLLKGKAGLMFLTHASNRRGDKPRKICQRRRSRRPQQPRAPSAAANRMNTANARASLMGNVGALFMEKSTERPLARELRPARRPRTTWRERRAAGPAEWSRRRSQTGRWPDRPRAWRRCLSTDAPRAQGPSGGGYVEHLELGADAHPFRMCATAERTLLRGGEARLHLQNPRTISATSAASVGLCRSNLCIVRQLILESVVRALRRSAVPWPSENDSYTGASVAPASAVAS